jgi:NADH dehydrogenase
MENAARAALCDDSEMILVAGGTGVLGTAIVRRLMDEGHQVRVLTRRRERAKSLAAAGAQVAIGDLRDRSSLAAACQGVTHVITTANAFLGTGVQSVDAVDELGNRNLINAARTARVQQFVFTSARVSPAYRTIDFFAAKFHTEAYLRESGVPWTILRPTAFMETWAMIVGDPLVRTGTTKIFGSGRNPINFVAVDDVAAVAVMTLDRADAINSVVEIGGPQDLTLHEVADVFETVTGRRGRRTRLPVPLLRALAAVMPWVNPVFARQVRAGLLSDTVPQTFNPADMLARFPVALTPLDAWVRARYSGTR